MQLLYNSDSYVVVQFELAEGAGDADGTAGRGGFEIVDKFARKEIYIQGALAESFQRGVQALVDAQTNAQAGAQPAPGEEAFDDFIAGYTALAQQPVVLH